MKASKTLPFSYNIDKIERQSFAIQCSKKRNAQTNQEPSLMHSQQPESGDRPAVVPEIVYAIHFGEDAMTIACSTGIIIYSLLTMAVIFTKKGNFWDAVFLPRTPYLACLLHGQSTGPESGHEDRRTVRVLDLEKSDFIASVTVTFQVETIKVGKETIALANSQEIAIMHFPSLKPIMHTPAGNGVINIFDLSREGLTLAYQYQTKGMLIVHNFVDRERMKKSMRQKSFSSNDLLKTLAANLFFPKVKSPHGTILEIKAHKENISMIRLSPNGYRVATACDNDRTINVFLTSSGTLWQQLNAGSEICKFLDINFSEEGSVLSCLMETNMVYLFNLKLQTLEQQRECKQRGYKVYQQSNPKSVFSFLSILNSYFGHEQPFTYFKLKKPQDERVPKNQTLDTQANQLTNPLLTDDPNCYPKLHLTMSGDDKSDGSKMLQEEQVRQSFLKDKRPTFLRQESGKTASISSLVKKENFVAKNYNTVSKVFIGGNNFVWAVKGSYIFMIKYDPFNGGEMYHHYTIKFYNPQNI